MYADGPGGFGVPAQWKEATWTDEFRQRKEEQELNLTYKRRAAYAKPGYIWVFYNNTDFFGGWFLYVKTLHESIALNWRNHKNDLIIKVMQLLPCGIIPIKENIDEWCQSFAKEYHHKGFKRKVQGLRKVQLFFNENHDIIDIKL